MKNYVLNIGYNDSENGLLRYHSVKAGDQQDTTSVHRNTKHFQLKVLGTNYHQGQSFVVVILSGPQKPHELGNVNLVEWNGGVEYWTGLLESHAHNTGIINCVMPSSLTVTKITRQQLEY